jgi:hypothetical protein
MLALMLVPITNPYGLLKIMWGRDCIIFKFDIKEVIPFFMMIFKKLNLSIEAHVVVSIDDFLLRKKNQHVWRKCINGKIFMGIGY